MLASRAFERGEDEFHQGVVFQHFGKSFSTLACAVFGGGRFSNRTVPVQVQVRVGGNETSQDDSSYKGGGRDWWAMRRVPYMDVSIDDSRVVAEVRWSLDSSLF